MFPYPRFEDIKTFNLEENKTYFHIIGIDMSIRNYRKDFNTNLM